jgi:tetratricopeptide (TPR) repeat protein
MEQSMASAHAVRLDELEPISVAGGLYLPLRRLLGVRAFGINAYTARAAGDQLIEPHDETGVGSGHQEEAYIVVSGHATFTVADREIDAPVGTIVFVSDLAATRSAVAASPDTTVIVVGGPADRPLPVSPFEYWFVAEAPYRAGDYRRAIEIVAEALTEWPDHPLIHYQLACYHALAGDRDEALDHLEHAAAADARVKKWADTDTDFEPIRNEARFGAITGS